jgi:hypothetical protein
MTEPNDTREEERARGTIWTPEFVRGVLSVLLVGGFVVTIVISIFVTVLSLEGSLDLLQTVGSLYSGVSGAVLGYWFGKGQS